MAEIIALASHLIPIIQRAGGNIDIPHLIKQAMKHIPSNTRHNSISKIIEDIEFPIIFISVCITVLFCKYFKKHRQFPPLTQIHTLANTADEIMNKYPTTHSKVVRYKGHNPQMKKIFSLADPFSQMIESNHGKFNMQDLITAIAAMV
jgi:hypothetical protein